MPHRRRNGRLLSQIEFFAFPTASAVGGIGESAPISRQLVTLRQ
jgi:hypothetical protein